MNNRDADDLWRNVEDFRRALPGGGLSISGLIKLFGLIMLTGRYAPPSISLPFLLLFAVIFFTSALTLKRCTNPTNAREDNEINQNKLIKIANNSDIIKKIPNEKLNEVGVCQGLMMTWYLNIHRGLENNFLKHLDKIKLTKDVSSVEAYELFDVNFFQKSQGSQTYLMFKLPEKKCFQIKHCMLKTFPLNKSTFDKDLENIIKNAIQLAILKLGNLISISFRVTKNSYHTIGLVAVSNENRLEIKFFDANFRKTTCADPYSAQKSLINLIKYVYKYQPLSLWDTVLSEIILEMYSARFCYPDEPRNSQTLEKWTSSCEWKSKFDGRTFFSKKNIINLKQLLDSEKQKGNTSAQNEWDKRWGLSQR